MSQPQGGEEVEGEGDRELENEERRYAWREEREKRKGERGEQVRCGAQCSATLLSQQG